MCVSVCVQRMFTFRNRMFVQFSAAKVYTPDWAESINYSETWHSTKCSAIHFSCGRFSNSTNHIVLSTPTIRLSLYCEYALATDWRNNCARIFFSEAFSWNSTRYYLCIQVVFLRINSLLCTLYFVEIVHILWKYVTCLLYLECSVYTCSWRWRALLVSATFACRVYFETWLCFASWIVRYFHIEYLVCI